MRLPMAGILGEQELHGVLEQARELQSTQGFRCRRYSESTLSEGQDE